MSNIKKLYIDISLNGNIKGSLDYNYKSNTDPDSNYKYILVPTEKIITKELLNKSKYNKDKIKLFFSNTALKSFISKIPKSQEDKSKNIIEENIKLILSLIFNVNSAFYVKGKKFIIRKRYSDFRLNSSIKKFIHKSYDNLIDEVIDKQLKKELSIINKRKKRLEKLKKNLESDKEQLAKLKKKYPFIDYTDDVLKSWVEEQIYSKQTFFNDVDKYANDIVKLLNNDPKNKVDNKQFKYVKDEGIKLVEDKSSGVNCSITLFLIDGKNPRMAERRLTCRNRKNNIIKLLNKLTEPLRESKKTTDLTKTQKLLKYTLGSKELKEDTKTKYHIDKMIGPLYSKKGYKAYHTKKKSNQDKKNQDNEKKTRKRELATRDLKKLRELLKNNI
uniref:Uncharacterized protein n=1 Tax=viral metagenome TaxID=1070528 RepID=A0A6C0AZM4_9ZZZZ